MTSAGGSLSARGARLRAAVGRFATRTRPTSSGGGVRLTVGDDTRERTRGVDRVFVGLGATLDAFPEILADALPVIRAAHRQTFRTEGAAGRGRWAPLQPATIRERVRKGYGSGPILLREGNLREHVLSTPARITRRGDTVELRIAPTPVVAGTGRPYYRAQALGYPPGNLPPRPMVAVGPAGAVAITSAISRALRERAHREGLG